MRAEDFAAWLAAISGMSSAQRAEAFATLEKAGAGDADAVAESSGRAPGKRGRREDALGTTSLERVEAQGCPHCAGREIVGWGRSHGLSRFVARACLRTFNALTETPMANLRMKDKWAAQAGAMIEGISLAKTAQRCGVHPTTAFRWRHRFLGALSGDKPRDVARRRRGRRDVHSEIIQRQTLGDTAENRAREAANRSNAGCVRRTDPNHRRTRPQWRHHRCGPTETGSRIDCCACPERALLLRQPMLNSAATAARAISVAFARRAGIAAHVLPKPGKPTP